MMTVEPQTPGRKYPAPLFQQYLVIVTFEIFYITVVEVTITIILQTLHLAKLMRLLK
jgi:hypothetical protein